MVIKKNIAAMDGTRMTTVKQVVDYARDVYGGLDDDQEHGMCMYLNGILELIKHKVVSSGHQNETALDPKIVFRNALLCGASRIIIFHNHEINAKPTPSKPDIEVTKILIDGGMLLGIEVIDHIILSRNDWYSFRNNDKERKWFGGK